MLRRLPVMRLSMPITSHPSLIKRSQRWEPRKPAAPVIRTRFMDDFEKFEGANKGKTPVIKHPAINRPMWNTFRLRLAVMSRISQSPPPSHSGDFYAHEGVISGAYVFRLFIIRIRSALVKRASPFAEKNRAKARRHAQATPRKLRYQKRQFLEKATLYYFHYSFIYSPEKLSTP